MALETGTLVSDLVATNPTGSDAKSQGDDHIRLIKTVLKTDVVTIAGTHAGSTKTTPVDADEMVLWDSAASYGIKRVTVANVKALFNSTYQLLTGKDATGGYVGLTLFKINFKNAANTFTSFFTNSNTAARTYTFQDRGGTIADDTDLALKADLASPALTGTPTAPTPTFGDVSTKIATTDFVATAFSTPVVNSGYANYFVGVI